MLGVYHLLGQTVSSPDLNSDPGIRIPQGKWLQPPLFVPAAGLLLARQP